MRIRIRYVSHLNRNEEWKSVKHFSTANIWHATSSPVCCSNFSTVTALWVAYILRVYRMLTGSYIYLSN